MSGTVGGRKWPRSAFLALRELVISVARIAGILAVIVIGFAVFTMSWRACNASQVRTFCGGIAPGDGRDVVIRRARSAGLEVLAEPNATQVTVRKRSWAGVGLCTIKLEGDRVTGFSFEDS